MGRINATRMNSLRTLGTQFARRGVQQMQRRKMSGHGTPEEEFATAERFLQMSKGGAVTLGVVSLYVLYVEMTHHPHHNTTPYPYIRIRIRADFPWGEREFFDYGQHDHIQRETHPDVAI